MILSALFSFLGGSAFRFIIGSVTDWLQKKQDFQQEQARMMLQAQFDQEAHVRQFNLIKLQSDLKLGEIKLVGEAAVNQAEAQAFVEAMKTANTPTGIKFIDGWNGAIRPAAATIAVAIWLLSIIRVWFEITEWDRNLVASIIGYYYADRHIGKSKK